MSSTKQENKRVGEIEIYQTSDGGFSIWYHGPQWKGKALGFFKVEKWLEAVAETEESLLKKVREIVESMVPRGKES